MCVCITFSSFHCAPTMISIWLDSFCHCQKITKENVLRKCHPVVWLRFYYLFSVWIKSCRNKSFCWTDWTMQFAIFVFFSKVNANNNSNRKYSNQSISNVYFIDQLELLSARINTQFDVNSSCFAIEFVVMMWVPFNLLLFDIHQMFILCVRTFTKQIQSRAREWVEIWR